MLTVSFYDEKESNEDIVKFVVIVAFFNNKLLVVRHKKRSTWEIPGGHKEDFESCEDAAKRELFEETGAKLYDLEWVCMYSVNRGELKSYGQLYFANVKEIGTLPESEIKEVKTVKKLPKELTYPMIQPHLYKKVLNHIGV